MLSTSQYIISFKSKLTLFIRPGKIAVNQISSTLKWYTYKAVVREEEEAVVRSL